MRPKIFASLIRLKDWEKALRLYESDTLDGLELRLDAFSDRDLSRLHKEVALTKRLPPLLITVRSPKEGGIRRLTEAKRKGRFLLFMPFASILDCELSSKGLLPWAKKQTRRYRKDLILSFHDLKKGMPLAGLEKILRKGKRHRPDLFKIAVHIAKPEDLQQLLFFLGIHKKKGLIVIGMGKAGQASRILFPMLGSRIAFGYITRPSAPGQLPVKMLKERLGSQRH